MRRTILAASFWSFKGKFVVVLEDDLKDTEAGKRSNLVKILVQPRLVFSEGQTDVIFNRFDLWADKKVNFHTLLDAKYGLRVVRCVSGS